MRQQILPQTSITDTLYNIFPAAAGRYRSAGGRSPNPIQKRRQRRAIRHSLASAYTTFAGRYPEWTAALFDEHFIFNGAAPILEGYLASYVFPDPNELADAWADQMVLSKQSRGRIVTELTPIAAGFLSMLDL